MIDQLKDMQKQFDGFLKLQKSAEANFANAIEDVKKQSPDKAKKLEALMSQAKTGKADPMQLFNEAIKLANS